MNKGLENLNDLIIENLICSEKSQERVRIIEKELKEKEQYEEILNDYGLTLANFREACLFYAWLKSEKLNFDNGAKKLKALNILKKYIDITFFFSNYEITEEDCDLLKEVL